MANIVIPANLTTAKTTKSIGAKITYYVTSRNFTALDKMYEKNKTSSEDTIEKYFNNHKTNIYIIVDNNYTLIDSSTTYDKNKYYYMEDGTAEENCYICNGDGQISVNEKTPSQPEIFTCPKCNGKKKLIKTTVPVAIVGVTVTQSDKTDTGYSIKYKIVPYGSDKTVSIDDKNVI